MNTATVARPLPLPAGVVPVNVSTSRGIYRQLVDVPGIRFDDEGKGINLVVDVPTGWAPQLLDGASTVILRRTVIFTTNENPYYNDALTSFYPSGIVSPRHGSYALLSALHGALAGVVTARQQTQLTVSERMITRLLILGMSTSEMAHRVSVHPKTVNAHISNILTKHGFDNRSHYVAHVLSGGGHEG